MLALCPEPNPSFGRKALWGFVHSDVGLRLTVCLAVSPPQACESPDLLKAIGPARDLIADLGLSSGKSIVVVPMKLRSIVLLKSSLGLFHVK
jgi:hypothetical protein